VLQSEKREKGKAGYIFSMRIDAENAARLVQDY
jgi:hypothetical protein